LPSFFITLGQNKDFTAELRIVGEYLVSGLREEMIQEERL